MGFKGQIPRLVIDPRNNHSNFKAIILLAILLATYKISPRIKKKKLKICNFFLTFCIQCLSFGIYSCYKIYNGQTVQDLWTS